MNDHAGGLFFILTLENCINMLSHIQLTTLVIFTSVMIYDFLTTESRKKASFMLRMESYAGGIILMAMGLFNDPSWAGPCLVLDIGASEAVMVMYPCSFERPGYFLKTALCFLIACILSSFLFTFLLPSGNLTFELRLFASSVMICTYCSLVTFSSTASKFMSVKTLFKEDSPCRDLEICSRLVHALLFIIIYSSCFCLATIHRLQPMFTAACTAFLAGHYLLMAYKERSGASFLVSRKTECKIIEAGRNRLGALFNDKNVDDRKMNALYERIKDYMSKEQPFLNDDFDMKDMAMALYSNKLYLSKTINTLSGRNFRQFVNYYRIEYAKSLMAKDPRLHFNEVSEMSGFHSVVSFNMAFKVNTGRTPSEWLDENLSSSGKVS